MAYDGAAGGLTGKYANIGYAPCSGDAGDYYCAAINYAANAGEEGELSTWDARACGTETDYCDLI